MPLITCPQCGARISDRAVKCVKCGYELKNLVKCEKCGCLHDKDVLDCPECGYNKEKELEEIRLKEEQERLQKEKEAEEKRIKEEQIKLEKEKAEEEKKLLKEQKKTEAKTKRKEFARKNSKWISLFIVCGVIAIVVCVALFTPIGKLTTGKVCYSMGNYDKAIELCAEIESTSSDEKIVFKAKELRAESLYGKAKSLYDEGVYSDVYSLCERAIQVTADSELKDSANELLGDTYLINGFYSMAIEKYNLCDNCEDKITETQYQWAVHCFEKEDYDSACERFELIADYKDSEEYLIRTYNMLFIEFASEGEIPKALTYIDKIDESMFSSEDKETLKGIMYENLPSLKNIEDSLEYYTALAEFEELDVQDKINYYTTLLNKKGKYKQIYPVTDWSDGLIYGVYGFLDDEFCYLKVEYNEASASFGWAGIEGTQFSFVNDESMGGEEGVKYLKWDRNNFNKHINEIAWVVITRNADSRKMGIGCTIRLGDIKEAE